MFNREDMLEPCKGGEEGELMPRVIKEEYRMTDEELMYWIKDWEDKWSQPEESDEEITKRNNERIQYYYEQELERQRKEQEAKAINPIMLILDLGTALFCILFFIPIAIAMILTGEK